MSHRKYKYAVIFSHDNNQSDFDIWANSEADAYRIAKKMLYKHDIEAEILMILRYVD